MPESEPARMERLTAEAFEKTPRRKPNIRAESFQTFFPATVYRIAENMMTDMGEASFSGTKRKD